MINLRPYQKQSIAEIDEYFRNGKKRVILRANTGAGKTTIATWMIERSLRYNYPTIFVVRGRLLVSNASETLDKYKIDHSVCMAGHYRYSQKKLVQVCSIDTLKARQNWPFKDQQPLIFLDEMHKDYSDMFEQYPDAFFVGMSGTPYNDNSHYQAVVCPIEGFELRDMGFLVPERIYCPHIIDVSAVKMKAGDFDKKQLQSVVTQSAVVGNVVQDWKDFGQNRPTLCFAVSVEHSLQLKQAFNDAGVSAVHIDASSSDEERANAKRGLISGKIKIACNVDIFSTGWDCPPISCILLARPTWSLTWYLQVVGRGLRPHESKTDCIILDNAGNVFRHGAPYRIREVSLEKPTKKKSRTMDTRVCTCEECFYVFDPEEHSGCPACGWVRPKREREVKNIAGTLVEYFESEEARAKHLFAMMRADYYKLEWVRKTKGKGGKGLPEAWVFSQLQKKYSPDIFAQLGKITVVPKAFQVDLAETPVP
jgi:superfamily II DNA or RNA helicase